MSAWAALVATLLALVVGKGFDVVHFALVSHRWCALHEQFEHGHEATGAACGASTHDEAPSDAVYATGKDGGAHGPEDGCAIIGAGHEKALQQGSLSFHLTAPDTAADDPAIILGAAHGRVPLSLAPKRSPPPTAT